VPKFADPFLLGSGMPAITPSSMPPCSAPSRSRRFAPTARSDAASDLDRASARRRSGSCVMADPTLVACYKFWGDKADASYDDP